MPIFRGDYAVLSSKFWGKKKSEFRNLPGPKSFGQALWTCNIDSPQFARPFGNWDQVLTCIFLIRSPCGLSETTRSGKCLLQREMRAKSTCFAVGCTVRSQQCLVCSLSRLPSLQSSADSHHCGLHLPAAPGWHIHSVPRKMNSHQEGLRKMLESHVGVIPSGRNQYFPSETRGLQFRKRDPRQSWGSR